MCLVTFAWETHPRYRLILAANRDELHARPSQQAHWWPDRPDLLAGRDLQAGGTWLAVSRSGRFATVTNYREHQRVPAGQRSRGEIVTDFIGGDRDPLTFVGAIEDADYAGVSVLATDGDDMGYASNRGDAARCLEPGIYGLGNASLDTPWSKIRRTKQTLRSLVDADKANPTELLRMLADRTPAPSNEIEDSEYPFSLEQAISAPFICSDTYGTRCSTILTIGNDGSVEFFERRFGADGSASGDTRFRFITGAGVST